MKRSHKAETSPKAEVKSTSANGMAIADVQAFALSFPVTGGARLGIGRAVKRDAVVVKVTTTDGLVGWGESHHGRAANVIAALVNTALRDSIRGLAADDVVGVWGRIYRMQLKSHGLGAAASMAMSGIDMALWDIRGKAVGWPLCRLLGGSVKSVKAYAGGVSLGWQEPASLVDEARPLVEAGYTAVKLRGGDTPARDVERVRKVRKAFGDELVILLDANAEYSVDDVRAVMPAFEELGVGWLEEPFPAHDYASYGEAKRLGRIPLAAGENHFTRFDFTRIIDDGYIRILQPDLSKAGGVTELLRIAAMASAWKLPIHPHSSMTGLNMAATIHFLAAIENSGYFEGDASPGNLFRDRLVDRCYELARDGTVKPIDKPGIGIEVDESFIAAHPFIEGPNYAA